MKKRVVVVGAGIIGAAIAYNLSRAGAPVTIVDKGEPAHGATANSFAWINASRGKKPYHYYQLNRQGIAAWHHLDTQLGGALQVRWGGSLEWQAEPTNVASVAADTKRHRSWGYPLQTVEATTLAQLEPNLKPGRFHHAIHSELEGHVDPVRATRAILEAAGRHGAQLMAHCAVEALPQHKGRIQAVVTSAGPLPADIVVLAAGVGSPALAALVDVTVPLKPSPGVLAHTAPAPPLLNRVVLSPHGHMKQKPDGRIVVGASFQGSDGSDNSPGAGRALLNRAAQSLPHLQDLALERVTLGWRVLPEDELPIIGLVSAVPNLYLAAMHSGITLAPLVGQLATLEILTEVTVRELEPYRLARFDYSESG